MNNNGNPPNNDVEIDLLELALVLWKKVTILAVCFALGFGVAFAYFRYMVTPLYQSSATIYVFNKTTSITSMTDIQIGKSLTGDFQYIAYTREVLNQVISELNLNTTAAELKKKVNVTNPEDTHMLKVTVTDPNPETAAQISNKLANILRDQLADIMNTDKPSMVEVAVPSKQPSSPAVLEYSVLGGALGLMVSAGIITILYVMDDTIKTDDDVKKYLELNVLAAIPYDPTIQKEDTARKRKRWVKKKFRMKSTNSSKKKKSKRIGA